jgi:hypothetical protein
MKDRVAIRLLEASEISALALRLRHNAPLSAFRL